MAKTTYYGKTTGYFHPRPTHLRSPAPTPTCHLPLAIFLSSPHLIKGDEAHSLTGPSPSSTGLILTRATLVLSDSRWCSR